MGIIGWIVVGLIAGTLGKLIMPGEDPGGIIVTILIGMAGVLDGGFGVWYTGILYLYSQLLSTRSTPLS